jgi:hypothetical protein
VSRYDELTADGARQLLQQIGQQLAEARADQEAADGRWRLAMQRLGGIIGDAKGLLPITEIAQITGLTRPTIYKVIEDYVGPER